MFDCQLAFVLRLADRSDGFVAIGDRWVPARLGDSPHVWLPISFASGRPVVRWQDEWDLSWFDRPDR